MSQVDVDSYVARSPLGSYHIKIIILISLCFISEGFDLNVLGAILPDLKKAWDISESQAGLLGSAGFLGMLFGSLIAGVGADKIGRRPTMIISVALFSFATVISALSPGALFFAVCRVFAGAGIGAMFPVAAALARELAPARWASAFPIWIMAGTPLGGVIAVFVARQTIIEWGWRPAVGACVVFLVLLPFLVMWLPESPSMQVRRGHPEGAFHTLRKLRDDPGPLTSPDQLVLSRADTPAKAPLGQLFSRQFVFRTVVLGIIFALCLIPFYGIQTWLPSLLVASGRSVTSSLTMTICLLVGGLVGNVANGFIVTKLGIVKVFIANYILTAVAIFALGSAGDSIVVAVLAFVSGGLVINASVTENAFAAHAYPGHLRATGIGWCMGVARFGAMAAPYLGGAVLDADIGTLPAYASFALPGVIATVLAIIVVRHLRKAPDVESSIGAPSTTASSTASTVAS